jgi:hypothetical protein
MSIFNNNAIWQPIVDIITDNAFIINEPRKSETCVFTHTLTSLRATCRAARAMIPEPTHLRPSVLAYEGAKIGSFATCELARIYMYAEYCAFNVSDFKKSDTHREEKTSAMYRVAIENGHKDIADFIWTARFEMGALNDIANIASLMEIVAKIGHLDACIDILEHEGYRVAIHMAKGAAIGRAINIINWMERYHMTSYTGLFIGAAIGNHIDICELALASHKINMHFAAHTAGKHANLEICAFLRKFAIQNNEMDAMFYDSLMTSCVSRKRCNILPNIHAWSVMDNIQPHYTTIISNALSRVQRRNGEIIEDDTRAVCAIIRSFCGQDGINIDYDAILRRFANNTKYMLEVQKWSVQDKVPTTIKICHFLQ